MTSRNPTSRREFTNLLTLSTLATLTSPAFAQKISKSTLFKNYGVCTSYKNFPLIKSAGYTYVEDSTNNLLAPQSSDRAFQKILTAFQASKAKVLACNSFIPGSLRSTGKNANHQAVLKHADTTFRRAKLCGLKGIVFGSSASRKIKNNQPRPHAESQFIELLKKMAPLAHAQGIEIWLEPLNRKEDNLINTQLQGAAIIEKVNHPSLGLVCDLYHVAKNEEKPSDIIEAAEHIRHCHIAEKEKRTAPGTNNFDFTPYLTALHQADYQDSISMECRWDNFETRLPKALAYLKSQVNQSTKK